MGDLEFNRVYLRPVKSHPAPIKHGKRRDPGHLADASVEGRQVSTCGIDLSDGAVRFEEADLRIPKTILPRGDECSWL